MEKITKESLIDLIHSGLSEAEIDAALDKMIAADLRDAFMDKWFPEAVKDDYRAVWGNAWEREYEADRERAEALAHATGLSLHDAWRQMSEDDIRQSLQRTHT